MPGTRAPYFGHEVLLDQVNMLLKEFEEQPWISVKGKFKATVLTQCKILLKNFRVSWQCNVHWLSVDHIKLSHKHAEKRMCWVVLELTVITGTEPYKPPTEAESCFKARVYLKPMVRDIWNNSLHVCVRGRLPSRKLIPWKYFKKKTRRLFCSTGIVNLVTFLPTAPLRIRSIESWASGIPSLSSNSKHTVITIISKP